MRRPALALVLAVALVAAGCSGGGDDGEPPATTVATAPEPTTGTSERTIGLYRVTDGKIAVTAARVASTTEVGAAALTALGYDGARIAISDGVARVSGILEGDVERRAAIVYTLTQFPTVREVELAGERLTRADFEELAPAILVETPLPGSAVRSPVRVGGTANTFEATLQVAIADRGGRELVQRTVTATSGNGQRGTFEVSLPVDEAGDLLVVAYEHSAEDGSVVNRVEVPVAVAP